MIPLGAHAVQILLRGFSKKKLVEDGNPKVNEGRI